MSYDYNLSFDENRQNWRIDKWMLKHGVTAKDFEKHPQIEDVIKMIKIRDALWLDMNNSEQGIWAAYWNIVFHKKYPLRDKAWQKLEGIATNILEREKHQEELRQYIKARLKRNPKKQGS